MNSITLKWGSLKAWELETPEALKLIDEYLSDGQNVSAMAQRDTPRQKQIILDLIDQCDGSESIYLDWDGKYVTKQEAKDYIANYGKKSD